MAESNNPQEIAGTSENDPLDISELASLNEDYSVDFIEQLQNQLTESAGLKKPKSVGMDTNDADLFDDSMNATRSPRSINDDIDDNFIKKYKAKLAKQQNAALAAASTEPPKDVAKEEQPIPEPVQAPAPVQETAPEPEIKSETPKQEIPAETEATQKQAPAAATEGPKQEVPPQNAEAPKPEDNIEKVSGGNIIEKPLSKEHSEYKDSLDYLDNNVKYSKYVIYIDPENKDFIDSLTVKERKNLINRMIREQDSVIVTKKNLSKMQIIITHLIVAILTIAISVPCIYWVINVSLESTINNYKTSQKMFQVLYKEKGKIHQVK